MQLLKCLSASKGVSQSRTQRGKAAEDCPHSTTQAWSQAKRVSEGFGVRVVLCRFFTNRLEWPTVSNSHQLFCCLASRPKAGYRTRPVKILGIIPARYASTRFPGKPLALIAGKPLIQHVVQRCQQASTLSEVIVATDDERIRQVAETFCRVDMTATHHPSGSDRIAEVSARCARNAVVNIQGDAPLIDPAAIDAVARA